MECSLCSLLPTPQQLHRRRSTCPLRLSSGLRDCSTTKGLWSKPIPLRPADALIGPVVQIDMHDICVPAADCGQEAALQRSDTPEAAVDKARQWLDSEEQKLHNACVDAGVSS